MQSDELSRLQQLQSEMRAAVQRVAEVRMQVIAISAAAANGWGSPPSAQFVQQLDELGASAEAKWRELDLHLSQIAVDRNPPT